MLVNSTGAARKRFAALASAFLAVSSMPAVAAPELSAVWTLYRAEQFGTPKLTIEGQRAKEQYDFRTADPALRCIPASWTRVYSNPNTPLEISQHDDRVVIRYELFDIERSIPLVSSTQDIQQQSLSTGFPELGSSLGWYDGDVLVVYTNNYGKDSRVLSTIRQWAGLHQSALMSTVERYRRDGDTLQIEITHFDPVMYQEPLVVGYSLSLETEFVVEHYGCDPEDAGVNSLDESSSQ